MHPFSRFPRTCLFATVLACAACGGTTDPGSALPDTIDGLGRDACDRYCEKRTTVQCGEENTMSSCLEYCDLTRGWAAPCEARADALLDCITSSGTAQCQGYNGEAEVVAPAGACDAAFAAYDACKHAPPQ